MSGRTTARSTRALRRAPLIAVALLAIVAATALAAVNTLHAHVPSNAQANQNYKIKLHGHATGTKVLYVFLDYAGCRQTPAGEHQRANGYIWRVSGDYTEAGVGNSPHSGTNHVCAYLVKNSAPKNPRTGIVATDFVTFTIH
ncbi:MAG TPA: hypothetical protein VGF70_10285 [Solirubrobacteraceae bacterium]|jgi:hypothetical protein